MKVVLHPETNRKQNTNKSCYFYRYNGTEFVEVYEIKSLNYTSNDDSSNRFGFTSAILDDVVVVSDLTKKKIHSASLVKNDKNIASQMGINLDLRPQNLNFDIYYELTKKYELLGS